MSRQTGGSNLTNQVVTNADAAQSQPHQQPPVNNFVSNGPMPTTVNSEMGDGMQENLLPSAQDRGTTSLVHQRDGGCEPAPAQARYQDPLEYFQPAPTSSTFQELLPELLGNDRSIAFFLQEINGGTYLPTTDNATLLSPIVVPQVPDSGPDQAIVQTPSDSVSNFQEVVEQQKKDQVQQHEELTEINKARGTNEQKKARRREKHAQNTALLKKNPEEIEDPKEAERRNHLEKIRVARNERNRERKKNMTKDQKEKAKEISRRYRKAKREQHLINHPKPTETEKKQAAALRRKERREKYKRLDIAAKQVSSEQPSTSQQQMSE
ncbi:hypothetical protein CAEBREN_08982 [Caenorhabditis brenneri]|uniref:Uncharacterized protein n=1 Tax=Caenorhabditis brenneri TaxID=135651 RepID=G0MW66_CAEBE|nr:hypothetical protein CAEBREN_08982 [Caenorhabditis brenneri]